jgi:DNA-binding CsgD family transcriptional regulator
MTPREAAIARLVSEGRTHMEIAARLKLSPATVRNHIQAIYGKLRVTNKAELSRALQLV